MTTATVLHFDIKLPRLGYSLNARVHWSERARVNRIAKETTWVQALNAGAWSHQQPPETRRSLTLHVVWPRNRKGPMPDEDALPQILKGCVDGIALSGLLVDDSPKWCDYRKPTQEKGEHTGYVLVRAEVGPA